MLLRLHRPAPPLDRFVELITYFEGYRPEHAMERLLPDGGVEIILDLTDTPKRTFRRDDLSEERSFRNAWISGMRQEWIVIEAGHDSTMAVIRFRPGGAYPFLGFPLTELTDVVVELDRVLGRRAVSLRDRVLELGGPDARIRAIESWLLEVAARELEPHPVAEFLVEQLHAPGATRITDLVGRIGFSHKHVVATFKRWVGLPPKPYCRIRRFQQAVNGVCGRDDVDWADVALDCGYYDQAHFGNDFRHFTGLSPTAFLDVGGEYPNYLPIIDPPSR